MATTNVTINQTTFTEVLDGAGFVYCNAGVYYAFAATTPTSGDFYEGGSQMNGIAGQKLWAKSIGGNAGVSSNPEA